MVTRILFLLMVSLLVGGGGKPSFAQTLNLPTNPPLEDCRNPECLGKKTVKARYSQVMAEEDLQDEANASCEQKCDCSGPVPQPRNFRVNFGECACCRNTQSLQAGRRVTRAPWFSHGPVTQLAEPGVLPEPAKPRFQALAQPVRIWHDTLGFQSEARAAGVIRGPHGPDLMPRNGTEVRAMVAGAFAAGALIATGWVAADVVATVAAMPASIPTGFAAGSQWIQIAGGWQLAIPAGAAVLLYPQGASAARSSIPILPTQPLPGRLQVVPGQGGLLIPPNLRLQPLPAPPPGGGLILRAPTPPSGGLILR